MPDFHCPRAVRGIPDAAGKNQAHPLAEPGTRRQHRERNRAVRQVTYPKNHDNYKDSTHRRRHSPRGHAGQLRNIPEIPDADRQPAHGCLRRRKEGSRRQHGVRQPPLGGCVHRPCAGSPHRLGSGEQHLARERPPQRGGGPCKPQGRTPGLSAIGGNSAQRRRRILCRQRPLLDIHHSSTGELGNRHLRQNTQQQAWS